MGKPVESHLSRRERQVMDILFARGRCTANEVRESMADPPSNSAVRGILRGLESKGYLAHAAEDLRYVYFPTTPTRKAQRTALRRLLEVFFQGNEALAANTLLDIAGSKMSDDDFRQLEQRIRKAAKGKKK